jgi:hypothetical protein
VKEGEDLLGTRGAVWGTGWVGLGTHRTDCPLHSMSGDLGGTQDGGTGATLGAGRGVETLRTHGGLYHRQKSRI